MNKQEIIKVIRDERIAHEIWADQQPIIADSINLDDLIPPINYIDSDLHTWLKANKNSISAFAWYKELEQAHVKVHYSYSDLFENATRKYNPKTREELLEEFQTVKTDIVEFSNKIDEIEKDITEMSDIIYLDYVLKSNDNITNLGEVKKSTFEENQDEVVKPDNTKSTFSNIKEVEKTDIETTKSTENDNSEKLNTSKKIDTTDASSNNDKIALSNISETHEVTETVIEKTKVSNILELDSKTMLANAKMAASSMAVGSASDEMKKIDISEFNDSDISKMDENKTTEVKTDKIVTKNSDTNNQVKPEIDNAKLISDYNSIKNGTSSNENLERHIVLKEQNIKRLQSEKALSEQELKHLEVTQKLSKQGVEQLEQHLSLKQEEVELEQLDNEKLLEINTFNRDQKAEQLEKIEQEKNVLKNEIIDLEQENIKDELVQEDFKKTPSIEKQFDILKINKVKELEKLQTQLSDKNAELIQLKQQVLTLADEVADIEDEIEMKQQSIDDLEDKEKNKNEERSLKLEANANVIKQRNTTINDNNQKLYVLDKDAAEAQKELNELIINFEKMKKTIFSMADVNDAEIDDIESQQLEKQNKLTDIYNQKITKQDEIDSIDARIEDAEKILEQLKSELEENTESDVKEETEAAL